MLWKVWVKNDMIFGGWLLIMRDFVKSVFGLKFTSYFWRKRLMDLERSYFCVLRCDWLMPFEVMYKRRSD